jgi:hypothetical protein
MRVYIQFNKIYVIQSLPTVEPQTGTHLFQDIIERRAVQLPGFGAELADIHHRAGLEQLFKSIIAECDPKGMRPYLHFEMHGSQRGLTLRSGELASWGFLYSYFVAINEILKNQLFISLACCYGAYMFNAVNPLRRSPVFAYIGPPNEIDVGDLEVDFTAYFDTLLQKLDLDAAIDALNDHKPNDQKYIVNSAEMIFDIVAGGLLHKYRSRAVRRARIQQLVKDAWKDHELRKRFSKEALRNRFNEEILHQPAHIELLKEYFLFRRATQDLY